VGKTECWKGTMRNRQSLLEHMALESTGGEPAGFDYSVFFLREIDGALQVDPSRVAAVQARG